MRLVLFEPDIPQNVGAMIRLGACLGIPIEIIEPCAFPLSDKGLRRVALDYLHRASIRRHISWRSFAAERAPNQRWVLLTKKAAIPAHRFAFAPDDALIVGRESQGAPEYLHAAADARVIVPMVAGVRSLNVVTAAAIVLGEALRQTDGYPRVEKESHGQDVG
ncbi:MAG: tRNA (cytidine(34)-2'-O)-methyltransferase [Alphaproteobacteria bacterium]|nr:tRNA (cytidine(34)-2'-O)-methyltransferase [Alphaproteobacteria bacterium]